MTSTNFNDLGLSFRPVNPDELSFVLDSWLKSYRGSPWAGVLRNNRYFEETRGTIEDLLARGAKLWACVVPIPETEKERIVGFICYEAKSGQVCIHYVYVKDPYRRLGIAKALVSQATAEARQVFYTFRTRSSKFVLPGAIYAREIACRESF